MDRDLYPTNRFIDLEMPDTDTVSFNHKTERTVSISDSHSCAWTLTGACLVQGLVKGW